MTKSIYTLVEDIYDVVSTHEEDVARFLELGSFSEGIAKRTGSKLQQDSSRRQLSLSQIGRPCSRQIWYSIKDQDRAERLNGPVKLKFLFGDILEELLIFLAKETGHKVEGEQDEVTLEGVTGHIDCFIDGHLIDVKSASTIAFQKFRNHLMVDQDSFGYLGQINSYLQACQQDRRLVSKDRSAFLVIDKTLGNVCIDKHVSNGIDYRIRIGELKKLLDKDTPPPRGFDLVPEGKSGNKKLGVECSYCPFKRICWPQMRTFLYAKGPTYLVIVMREPKVPEIKEENYSETED